MRSRKGLLSSKALQVCSQFVAFYILTFLGRYRQVVCGCAVCQDSSSIWVIFITLFDTGFSSFGVPSVIRHKNSCYLLTNHALDQFLEDLINIGIPRSEIVRIGGNANQATADLSLQSLSKSSGFLMSIGKKLKTFERTETASSSR